MVVLCLAVWHLLSHVDQHRSSVSSDLLALGACRCSSGLLAVGRGESAGRALVVGASCGSCRSVVAALARRRAGLWCRRS